MNPDTCPICNDAYKEQDKKVEYHVTYKPEVTTYTCTGCNYAGMVDSKPKYTCTIYGTQERACKKLDSKKSTVN